MNELTPPQNKLNPNIINMDTPLGENKYNNMDILNLNEEGKKFKTISHLKQYNNITNDNLNNISQKLFDYEKEKGNYFNNTASIINNNDKKNEKINFKLKIKSTPKNRKSSIPEEQSGENKIKNNNINILSKSSNDMIKFKKIIKDENIILTENNNQKKPEDDDSENLSALAEDLLSMSDENVQLMRKGPINKNDFIGESKEFYNIYKKQENKIINMNINKNKINIDSTKPMPKLQTKLYSSPLDKLNIKNSTHINNIKNSNKKNYNNINTNLYSFQLNDKNNTQYIAKMQTTQISAENTRAYATKVKNHISSNSIQNGTNINNNININVNINSNNNNNILNNLFARNQVLKNNVTGNNINQIMNNYNMFSKTGLNQYNKNYILELNEDNLNNLNKINNNHSVGKKKVPLNMNIKNNSNSNRNIKNKSIIKQINSMGLQNNLNASKDFMNKSNLNINNNAQYYNNINKNIIFTRTSMNVNNLNNMNNKMLNTNYPQNINLMNNNNTNNNYNFNNKNINFSLNSQVLKKTQTSNWPPQNNNPKQQNNIEHRQKNISNINMNKKSVINSYVNNYNNNYQFANKLDYVSKAHNNAKNLQSYKILRQSDYHKVSNKNISIQLDENNNNIMNNNNVNNQQIYLDKSSNLIRGKNKNSYTNLYNFLDVNNNKIRKTNFYNNNDMISQKMANTFNLNNYREKGYLNDNIYTYDGQNETVEYI